MADISKIQLVDLKNTDYFSKDQDIAGLSPSFREAAFSVKKGEISEPVQVFQDYAILQVTDTKPTEIEPFEKVQEKATNKVREEKLAQVAKVKAQNFSDSSAGATDLKAAAEKEKLEVKTTEPFTKDGFINEIPNGKEVGQKAFSMEVGQISAPVKTDEGYVIFQLKEKKSYNPADFAKQKDNLRQQIAQQKENGFIRAYRDMLHKKYQKQIWINDKLVTTKEET